MLETNDKGTKITPELSKQVLDILKDALNIELSHHYNPTTCCETLLVELKFGDEIISRSVIKLSEE